MQFLNCNKKKYTINNVKCREIMICSFNVEKYTEDNERMFHSYRVKSKRHVSRNYLTKNLRC